MSGSPVALPDRLLRGSAQGDTSWALGKVVDDGAGYIVNEARQKISQGDIGVAHEDESKDNIIAILEDWAAWESDLEREAEKDRFTRNIEGVADQHSSLDEARRLRRGRDSIHHTYRGGGLQEGISADGILRTRPQNLQGTSSLDDSKGSLDAQRRNRRRMDRHDPVARARRQALKSWSIDKTMRRASADSHGVGRDQAHLRWEELRPYVRSSSGEKTVDRNRQSADNISYAEGSHENPQSITDSRLGTPPAQRREYSSNMIRSLSPLLVESYSHKNSKRRDSCAWRANMKARKGQSPFISKRTNVRSGELNTESSHARFAGSNVMERASAWARSPSRESAGGIIENQTFFYGPGPGISGRRKTASPSLSSSFESPWMRQFRLEVQSNPNWWAGPAPNRSEIHAGASFQRSMSQSGSSKVVGDNARTLPLLHSASRKQIGADRGTKDIWSEVRCILAGDRDRDYSLLSESKGSGNSDCETPVAAGKALSFDDRLRYTPLSQGAWLDASAGVKVSANNFNLADGVRSSGKHDRLIAEEEGSGKARFGNELTVREETLREPGFEGVSLRSESRLSNDGGKSDAVCGATDGESRRPGTIHDAIFLSLRGEIDASTRETIIMRAAKDARGALARNSPGSISPRRAPSGRARNSSASKVPPLPNSIDYDKVEATLSLIELAARAAGPDAGKQTLQGLKGLNKLHQRASVDEIEAHETAECTVKSVDDDGPRRGKSDPRENEGHANVGEVEKEVIMTDGDERSLRSRSKKCGVRRLSLAVSSSSDEISNSDTTSGLIATIGTWLWGSTTKTQCRKSSGVSEITDPRGDQAPGKEKALTESSFFRKCDTVAVEPSRVLEDMRYQEESSTACMGEMSLEVQREKRECRSHRTVGQEWDSKGVRHQQHLSPEIFEISSLCESATQRALTGSIMPTQGSEERSGGTDAKVEAPANARSEPDGPQAAQETQAACSFEASSNTMMENFDKERSPYSQGTTAVDLNLGDQSTVSMRCDKDVGHEERARSALSGRDQHEVRKSTSIQELPATFSPIGHCDSCVPAEARGRVMTIHKKPMTVAVARKSGEGGAGSEAIPSTTGRSNAVHRRDSWAAVGSRPQRAHGPQTTVLVPEREKGGEPSVIATKFLWPTAGKIYATKRLAPSSAAGRMSAPCATPGIVRRSPLIDALHPAVAKQRLLHRRLRQTQQRENVGSPRCKSEKPFTAEIGSPKAARPARSDLTVTPTEAVQNLSCPRARETWTAAPRPSSTFSQPHPIPGLSARPEAHENAATASDTAMITARLTDVQSICLEAWLARVRRLLGPAIWDCLGSTAAFVRVRRRIKEAMIAEDSGEVATSTVDKICRPPQSRDKRGEWRGQKARTKRSKKWKRQGSSQNEEAENCGEKGVESWGDHLSQKAALVVEAVMWTLADDREQSAVCAAIAHERAKATSRPLKFAPGSGSEGGQPHHENARMASAEVGISLPKARRFIKGCSLIDGVHVLAADVDLAFRRWEQIAPKLSFPSCTATFPCKQQAVKAPQMRRNIAAHSKVCEAVGCSGNARYGEVHPEATARLCRKHRRGGMVDVGGRRCERLHCGHLAVGDSISASPGARALCSLHSHESRVGLDGMAFVLVELAKARQPHARVDRMKGEERAAGDGDAQRDGKARDLSDVYAPAVRNVLLALTDQLLVLGAPAAARASLPRKKVMHVRQVVKNTADLGLGYESMCAVFSQFSSLPLACAASRDVLHSGRGVELPHGTGKSLSGVESHNSSSAVRPRDREQCRLPQPEKHIPLLAWDETPVPNLPPLSVERTIGEGTTGGTVIGEHLGCGTQRSGAYGSDEGGKKLAPAKLAIVPWRGDHGDRYRGIDKVLARNATSLQAVFRVYARPSGHETEMVLPDVLQFCDAFELRPGLVSTREVLDAFKEVAHPGVLGLTDEDIGYSHSAVKRRVWVRPPSPRKVSQTSLAAVTAGDTRSDLAKDDMVATLAPNSSASAPEGKDECSVYFRSHSGSNSERQSSSRRSSASSSVPSKRKRTLYLGKTQRFPLRRVGSIVVSSDGGVGLNRIPADDTTGHNTRRGSFRKLSLNPASGCSRSASVAFDDKSEACDVKRPSLAKGLSQLRFSDWLAELALGCSALTKAFGRRLKSPANMGYRHQMAERSVSTAHTGRVGGVVHDMVYEQNAAKAVALLQWMEVSRGMRRGAIPLFSLSTCFPNVTMSR